MKGAREYYNLIEQAHRNKFPNLIRIGGWNGGDSQSYKIGNIIFITATHARGKEFFIVLTNLGNSYDIKEIKNSNTFEVYGVIGGQPGWTEFYGWKENGNWNNEIEKIFEDIRKFIEVIEKEKEILKLKEMSDEKKTNKDKIDFFNSIF